MKQNCGEDNVVNFNTITKSVDNMSADGHGSYLVIRVTWEMSIKSNVSSDHVQITQSYVLLKS